MFFFTNRSNLQRFLLTIWFHSVHHVSIIAIIVIVMEWAEWPRRRLFIWSTPQHFQHTAHCAHWAQWALHIVHTHTAHCAYWALHIVHTHTVHCVQRTLITRHCTHFQHTAHCAHTHTAQCGQRTLLTTHCTLCTSAVLFYHIEPAPIQHFPHTSTLFLVFTVHITPHLMLSSIILRY